MKITCKTPILIQTFKDYHFCLPKLFACIEKYTNFTKCKVYLATNDVEDYNANYKVKWITPIETKSEVWSERLNEALTVIPNDYVYYMQEDFWPFTHFFVSGKDEEFLKDKNGVCLRFYKIDRLIKIKYGGHIEHRNSPYFVYCNDSNYILSHQFSLWKKETLQKFTQEKESPWENECAGNKRVQSEGIAEQFLHMPIDWYINACNKGKLTNEAVGVVV